jgi:release factor glutamine methyltransferase
MSATVGDAVADLARRLAAAGIADPRREARLVAALAIGVDPAIVLGYPERLIDDDARIRLDALAARRAAHEPLSRLRGSREFWSRDFALSPDTLDPRADSETLIAAALDFLPDRRAPWRVVDFGTGTGCLLLALLGELPHATGIGIDIAPAAIETARANAESLGLTARAEFRLGDWDRGLDAGAADVILANPPYIPSNQIALLPPDVVRFDPLRALDGGRDGLDAYRALAPAAARVLASPGLAVFEIGAGQSAAVIALLAGSGLQIKAIRRDLSGTERCIVATL